MAQNKILPWAQTSTANALSDSDYAADVATGGSYADGVKSGQASSKQANKTWRQATAPGSGLGQFLVDNLGVDVTDADTPATFSTRIANAVLKLAQVSPFNQAWVTATGGYRKYAIVSDSSGNFWVSTADQNTTVPGASGAKWRSLFDGYATNPALNTEITNRTNADANLQNQINNRVQKIGDTMTGGITFTGNFTPIYYNSSSSNGTTGQMNDAIGMITRLGNRGNWFAQFGFREYIGSHMASMVSVYDGANWSEYDFPQEDYNGGRITGPAGTMAVTSDLPFGVGAKAQIFNVTIPAGTLCGYGQQGYLVNLPSTFSNFMGAWGSDIGYAIYTPSISIVSNSQFRLWAQSPQATDGVTGPVGPITIRIMAVGVY